MEAIAFVPWIVLVVLAFWHPSALLFMILGGVSMMLGLYTPDIMNGTTSTALGQGIGLMIVMFAFVSVALAYKELLSEE